MIKVDLLNYSFKLLLCTCFFLCISCDFYITENALSCPCSRDYFCCQKEKKCVENLYDCSNATKENNSNNTSDYRLFAGNWYLKKDCELTTIIDETNEVISGYSPEETHIEGLTIQNDSSSDNISVSYLFVGGLIHETINTVDSYRIKNMPMYENECNAYTLMSSSILNNVSTTYIDWEFLPGCPEISNSTSITTMNMRKENQLLFQRFLYGTTSEKIDYTQKLKCNFHRQI